MDFLFVKILSFFLGATLDGTVYDLSSSSHPVELVEVKGLYYHKDHSPVEACAIPDFLPDGRKQVMLQRNHPYFAQGQVEEELGVIL